VHPGILVGLGAAALLTFALTRGESAAEVVTYQRGMVIGDSHSRPSWGFGGRLGKMLNDAGIPTQIVAHGGRGAPWFVSGRYPALLPRPGRGSNTLKEALADFHPDLLIVALGANDALLGIVDGYSHSGEHKLAPFPQRQEQYLAVLAEFVQIAKDAGVRKIIWFGPSKSEGEKAHLMPNRDKIAKWQAEMLPTLNVEWHDSMPLTYDLPTRDGVHYRSAEYGVWSDRAAQLIFDDVRVA